jgi:hypothetical protein
MPVPEPGIPVAVGRASGGMTDEFGVEEIASSGPHPGSTWTQGEPPTRTSPRAGRACPSTRKG